uniref:UVR domain-containing protein n=1 Tax=Fagus sylvatica TaxID=28930 RepID=A0A2N9IJP9_FAGSY
MAKQQKLHHPSSTIINSLSLQDKEEGKELELGPEEPEAPLPLSVTSRGQRLGSHNGWNWSVNAVPHIVTLAFLAAPPALITCLLGEFIDDPTSPLPLEHTTETSLWERLGKAAMLDIESSSFSWDRLSFQALEFYLQDNHSVSKCFMYGAKEGHASIMVKTPLKGDSISWDGASKPHNRNALGLLEGEAARKIDCKVERIKARKCSLQNFHGLPRRDRILGISWIGILPATHCCEVSSGPEFLRKVTMGLVLEFLRHAQLPEEARELEKELRQNTKEKNEYLLVKFLEDCTYCNYFPEDGGTEEVQFVSELIVHFYSSRNKNVSGFAGELRDREMDLKAQITALVDKGKEMSKAETEAGDVGPLVTEVDIQHIVSSWTGIPVEKVSTDESDRLLKMEETLHKRVIGQDEAVKAISRAIRRARVGLKNPNRPIASFIFSGPTGVGKSELAKALAAYYFGSEEAMIRLDMSEFMERHTVSKLIGSPPGYVGYTEGGQLTEAVRRRPYTVVLFDEIEKAHPDVFNMMLQILEDGRLTDSKGRTVDFKNTLLIMTSNVGSSVIEKGGRRIGFDLDYDEKDSSYNRIKSLVTEELKQYFRPEFLNRLDEMIVFRQLTKLEVKDIADIMLKEVFDRLKTKDIELQVTERFRDRVVDEGYNPSYGARPLRRAIMRLLEDSMAEKMLSREIKEGDSVIVDVDSDGKVNVLNGSSGAPESLPEALPVK